jgi:hypothetical protein
MFVRFSSERVQNEHGLLNRAVWLFTDLHVVQLVTAVLSNPFGKIAEVFQGAAAKLTRHLFGYGFGSGCFRAIGMDAIYPYQYDSACSR